MEIKPCPLIPTAAHSKLESLRKLKSELDSIFNELFHTTLRMNELEKQLKKLAVYLEEEKKNEVEYLQCILQDKKLIYKMVFEDFYPFTKEQLNQIYNKHHDYFLGIRQNTFKNMRTFCVRFREQVNEQDLEILISYIEFRDQLLLIQNTEDFNLSQNQKQKLEKMRDEWDSILVMEKLVDSNNR